MNPLQELEQLETELGPRLTEAYRANLDTANEAPAPRPTERAAGRSRPDRSTRRLSTAIATMAAAALVVVSVNLVREKQQEFAEPEPMSGPPADQTIDRATVDTAGPASVQQTSEPTSPTATGDHDGQQPTQSVLPAPLRLGPPDRPVAILDPGKWGPGQIDHTLNMRLMHPNTTMSFMAARVKETSPPEVVLWGWQLPAAARGHIERARPSRDVPGALIENVSDTQRLFSFQDGSGAVPTARVNTPTSPEVLAWLRSFTPNTNPETVAPPQGFTQFRHLHRSDRTLYDGAFLATKVFIEPVDAAELHTIWQKGRATSHDMVAGKPVWVSTSDVEDHERRTTAAFTWQVAPTVVVFGRAARVDELPRIFDALMMTTADQLTELPVRIPSDNLAARPGPTATPVATVLGRAGTSEFSAALVVDGDGQHCTMFWATSTVVDATSTYDECVPAAPSQPLCITSDLIDDHDGPLGTFALVRPEDAAHVEFRNTAGETAATTTTTGQFGDEPWALVTPSSPTTSTDSPASTQSITFTGGACAAG